MPLSKEKKEIIITSILGVVLVFILIKNFWIPYQKAKTVSRKVTAVEGKDYSHGKLREMVSEAKEKNEILKLHKKRAEMDWNRNPFARMTSSRRAHVGPIRLSGIILDERGAFAVINDQIVRLGEDVNGMVLKDIRETSVVLKKDGEEVEVFLFE